jgi:Na+-translocating ferredoxin:NAD+ oxidoreductase RnfC subunit
MTGEQPPHEFIHGPLRRTDWAFAALPGVAQERRPPRPCIACGACARACPTGLLPYALHRLAGRDLVDEAEGLGIENCVECGLCTFACPSKIELLAEIVTLKEELAVERESD